MVWALNDTECEERTFHKLKLWDLGPAKRPSTADSRPAGIKYQTPKSRSQSAYSDAPVVRLKIDSMECTLFSHIKWCYW